jgi:membrane dipeptidase
MSDPIPYFDGHNDALLRLFLDKSGKGMEQFVAGGGPGHIDLPRARQGNFVGGLFATFSPPAPSTGTTSPNGVGERPLPPRLTTAEAWVSISAEAALFFRLIDASEGAISQCRSAADIRAAMAKGSIAAVLHMEGADAIDPDLYLLDVLYEAGLRSLGPVWSRQNGFGWGVPFSFPSTPDIGPGLTEDGKRLVAACNAKGILIDLSHLNEAGFWDVAKLSSAPLVATHSNVHSISASPRNLTDKQLDAIRESNGLVGLNFATSFLREDGQMRAETELEWMVRHVDALVEKLGEDRVGIGSDFDGATVPSAIGSVAGVPKLFEALRAHGYDETLLRKIGAENWLGVLERTWGE